MYVDIESLFPQRLYGPDFNLAACTYTIPGVTLIDPSRLTRLEKLTRHYSIPTKTTATQVKHNRLACLQQHYAV